MSSDVVILDPADNVATAIAALESGQTVAVGGRNLAIAAPIPFGHKIALAAIRKGDRIVKYGEPIGIAREDIPAGEHVHVHNVESERGRGDKEAGK